MPSLWPFGRNKKKKQQQQQQQKLHQSAVLSEEKLQYNQDADDAQPPDIRTTRDRDLNTSTNINLDTRRIESPNRLINPKANEISATQSIRDENEKTIEDELFSARSFAHAQTEELSREPLVEIENLAGARNNNTFGQPSIASLTSLQPEHTFTTQPLYGVPTLRSKRSSATSEILRSKSKRSKSSIKEREREIRALTSPIPIPSRFSSLYSSSPLARDTKKIPGGLDRRLHRPTSEVSLPMVESLRTSFSGESGPQHSYRVTAFDALSPRPTIRYGERPSLPSVREKSSRSMSKKDKGPAKIDEIPKLPNPRARVKEMADDLDAREIREIMERDQRRRERKRALDHEKLQKKLQKKLEKQKADEAAATAARTASDPIELEGTPFDPITTMDPEYFIAGLNEDNIENNSTATSRRNTESSGRWTREMSKDDLPSTNPFLNPRAESRDETRLSSEQASIRDDAIIESATAVRLSTISMSPPASPVLSRERTMSPSNLSQVATVPRDSPEPSTSATAPAPGYLHPDIRREPETSGKQGSSWTSIFRRGGTKRKVSAEKEKEPPAVPEFSNVSRESFLRKNQPPSVPVVQRSFKRDGVPQRKQSKFREDLPELPISPPRSRMQSPELDRPISPYVDDTQKLDSLNNNNTVATPIEDIHPALRDQLTSSRQQSFQGPSPEPVLLSQSLASIDSEGSWLSGRPRKRSSVPISSVRESLASLTQPLEDNEDEIEEPDFARRDFSANTIRGPGGLSSQLRSIQTGADADDPRHPYDESVKYDTVIGRRPNIVSKLPMARSREGLLEEYIQNEDESPVSPLSPGAQDSPTGAESFIHRATSINIGNKGGHARQLSAGSARLLDIPARSSSDAKRASVISAASTTRSPLVSPRDSRAISPEPQ